MCNGKCLDTIWRSSPSLVKSVDIKLVLEWRHLSHQKYLFNPLLVTLIVKFVLIGCLQQVHETPLEFSLTLIATFCYETNWKVGFQSTPLPSNNDCSPRINHINGKQERNMLVGYRGKRAKAKHRFLLSVRPTSLWTERNAKKIESGPEWRECFPPSSSSGVLPFA